MNADFVSIVFAIASVGFMLIILRDPDVSKIRIALIWTAAAAIAFLVPIKGGAFLLIALAILLLAPISPVARVGVYLAVFMALPDYYRYDVPFPGLNYLIRVEFGKLATLILLGPVFFANAFKPAPPHLRSVERLLLAFVLITGVMSIRDLPFTSMIRVTVDQFLLIYIPYVAISRSVASIEDFDKVMRAFFAGVVILAAIGVISTIRDWNFYAALNEGASSKIYSDLRGGNLRIYATSAPQLLAIAMGAGIVCSLYLRSKAVLTAFHLAALIPIFLAVMYVTGSRGGQLASIVSIAAYLGLPRIAPMARNAVLPAALILVGCGLYYFLKSNVVVDDPYGTFQYRVDLLRTSMEQIGNRPLFGMADVRELESFEALRQGEGIVDVVNAYLSIALAYGLVGLAIYLAANFIVLLRVFGLMNAMDKGKYGAAPDRTAFKRLCALIAGLHIGFLVLILTTSGYSWTWNYGYALLALETALALALLRALTEATVPQPAVAETKEAAADEAETAPARPLPYGVRIVRRL